MAATDKLLGKSGSAYAPVEEEGEDEPRENGNEGPRRKYWPFSLTRRYAVAVLAFLGFCNIYSLRVNLSVAIVSMTETKEFTWDSSTQGLILSSFFYGYIVTQIPGGWLATKYGGKKILGYGVLITSILTLLTPAVARAGVVPLVILRILQGLAEGVSYPAAHALVSGHVHVHVPNFELRHDEPGTSWSKWAPAAERSRLVTIVFSGSYAGTVISLPVSGILADYYGWPSVFYVFGIVALLWTALWMWNISESPVDDKWISEAEVNYITCSLSPPSPSLTKKLPWKLMLTSGPVWAISAAHFAENWGFYTLLTMLPTYMKSSFGMNLSKSGFISAMPYLVMAVVVQLAGILADWLRNRYLSTTQVRKLFTCGAFMVQTTFIVGAAFITNPTGAIVFLTIAVGLGGFAWAGFSVNHLDIAPKYSSILMGISNTFATIPGMVSPIIAGWMVGTNGTAAEWRGVFSISGSIYFVGGIIYALLASGDQQPWAEMSPTDLATSCIEDSD